MKITVVVTINLKKRLLSLKRNLGGFSGVAHYEKPATPATPVAPVAPAVTEEAPRESENTQPAHVKPRVTDVGTANLIDAYRHGRNG